MEIGQNQKGVQMCGLLHDERGRRRTKIIRRLAHELELGYEEAEAHIKAVAPYELEEAIEAEPGSGAFNRLKRAIMSAD